MCKVRQMGETIDKIRDDHVARYRYAAGLVRSRGLTFGLDVGCGVGYGARLLAEQRRKFYVAAFDRDAETIEFAKAHYAHPRVDYLCHDLGDPAPWGVDLVTAFEVIEHTPDAIDFLSRVRAQWLVGSVPNEQVVPFASGRVNTEHYRHFTPAQIAETLDKAEWRVVELCGQAGKHGPNAAVTPGAIGKRTIVFTAARK